MERGKVKDLEFLVLADLSYERYEKKDEGDILKRIFQKHNFNDSAESGKSERKQRWGFFSERMEGWKLLEGFDVEKYKQEWILQPEDIQLQYKQFYAAAFEKDDEIVIAYRGTDGDNGEYDSHKDFKTLFGLLNLGDNDFVLEHYLTNGRLIAGIPGIQFKLAVDFYKDIKKHYKKKSPTISVTGHSLGGGLAQYVSVMEGVKRGVAWNGVGIKDFLKFSGNEFLGGGQGVKDFIEDMFHYNDVTDEIQASLINSRILEKDGEDIIKVSDKYLDGLFNKNEKDLNSQMGIGNVENLEDIAKNSVFQALLNYKIRDLKEKKSGKKTLSSFSISKNWRINFQVSSSDMNKKFKENFYEQEVSEDDVDKLWDKVKKYVENNFSLDIVKRKMEFIIAYKKNINKTSMLSYSISKDITGTLLKHIGKCVLVDDDMKTNNIGLQRKSIFKSIGKIVKKNLSGGAYHGLTMFYPHIKLEEKNKNEKTVYNKAEEKDITGDLNKDYLQSFLKGLLKHKKIDKNEDISKFLFYNIYNRKYGYSLIEELLKKDKSLVINTNKMSSLEPNELLDTEKFIKNSNILKSIEDLKKELKNYQLKELIGLEVKSGEAKIMLGSEKDDETVMIYNKDLEIDNKEEEIIVEITSPSKYNIDLNSNEGNSDYELYSKLGYKQETHQIRNVGIHSNIKIDGTMINGTYDEIDKEESMVNNKTERDTGCNYYGDNIMTVDNELRYYYGDNKEDVLIMKGYQQGNLGINLIEMEKGTENSGKGFTEHQLRIKGVSYSNLTKIEIVKEVNEHTKAEIEGLIKIEDIEKVRNYLMKEKQPLEIIYGEKKTIVFGGIIYDYDMDMGKDSCILKMTAYSTSKELEEEQRNRVYHNNGMKYQDLIDKINENYTNTHLIGFNSDLDKKEFITADVPVEVQYKESDWDFIKRLSNREKEMIIVQDIKTKKSRDGSMIAIGAFGISDVDLSNNKVLISRKTKLGIWEDRYKIKKYIQRLGEEIFTIGNPYKLNIMVNKEKKDELILIKNTIYMEEGMLKSDLELAREDEYGYGLWKREEGIKGISLKGRVKKVSNAHKAQIEYETMENEYDEGKSYFYSISRNYTGTYFTPEEETLVEIHFGDELGEATIRNVSSEIEDIDNDPDEKIIRTSFGKEVKFDKKSIKITGKDDESYVEINEEWMEFKKGEKVITLKDGVVEIKNNAIQVTLDDSKINMISGKSQVEMADGKLSLNNGGVGITIANGKINLG